MAIAKVAQVLYKSRRICIVSKTGNVYCSPAPLSGTEKPSVLCRRILEKGQITVGRYLKIDSLQDVPSWHPPKSAPAPEQDQGTTAPASRSNAYIPCTHCSGTGTYATFGSCFQCCGKGQQSPADQRRNWGYQKNKGRA